MNKDLTFFSSDAWGSIPEASKKSIFETADSLSFNNLKFILRNKFPFLIQSINNVYYQGTTLLQRCLLNLLIERDQLLQEDPQNAYKLMAEKSEACVIYIRSLLGYNFIDFAKKVENASDLNPDYLPYVGMTFDSLLECFDPEQESNIRNCHRDWEYEYKISEGEIQSLKSVLSNIESTMSPIDNYRTPEIGSSL